MSLVRLTPIDGDAILPIAEARAHLNLTADDSFHDTRVLMARNLGIDFAERYTGLVMLESQFRWSGCSFARSIRLPRGPVVSVDAIDYRDGDGTETALTSDDWHLSRDQVTAAFGTTWPSGDDVQIDFTAGHATIGDVPDMLKAGAIVAMAAYFSDQEGPDLTGARRCLDLAWSPAL